MKTLRWRGGRRWLYRAVALALPVVYGCWAAARPMPALTPTPPFTQLSIQTPPAQLIWPAGGQSAVGIVGDKALVTHGPQTPVPTASTAKLITALVVLHERPLGPGQLGPTITLGSNDVALYNAYAAQGGSIVPVAAGEQISEYQMLQAIMLPSANNMADSLAIWAFGSLRAYNAAAAAYLNHLGLTHTQVGADASGFAPTSTSTAYDLVRLGELAMQDPVLSQIAGQATASGLPLVNTVKNINWLLGTAHIIGIKTGNTEQAGGVFVSASRVTVNQQPVTIVTAVAGAPNLSAAMKTTLTLVQSAQINFRPASVIEAGSIVGNYHVPWGGVIPAVAARGLEISTWSGSSLPATITLKPIPAAAAARQTAGSLTLPRSAFASRQSVPIILSQAPPKPSLWWRLLHPF